uniref:HTH_Tnp_Tc3_1 domain-containing protein n=1 Tax=Heterorhabditis bacteriophora TaxID=37862 RepID=A0A1I7WCD8_HETBA
MGRASTLSLHERGQIKVLSTTGYTVKQIADVLKRFRKKSSGRPSKLNDCEKRTILPLLESVGLVALVLQKLRCGECWTSKCPQLTPRPIINYLEFR